MITLKLFELANILISTPIDCHARFISLHCYKNRIKVDLKGAFFKIPTQMKWSSFWRVWQRTWAFSAGHSRYVYFGLIRTWYGLNDKVN